ncbi:MAG: ORC-CDC6 family AAA ATPase [Ginsengibacter sp.]
MKDLYSNPFSGVNAVQLDTDLILEYWCNPFTYNLFSEIQEADIYGDPQNIVFMGGRSTGKSMFLRYWSYDVQIKICQRDDITLNDLIQKNKGVGFYFRIDGAKLKSFQGYGLSQEYWTSVFTHYFELIVGRSYIEVLKYLEKEKTIDKKIVHQTLIPKLCDLLDFKGIDTFEKVLDEFDSRIREVELYLGNVPFYKNEFKPAERGFSSQSLSFEIPELLISILPTFKSLNIILLLDEYENFLDYQQKVVNTLLRFTKPHIKFRIGMRLEGFRTFYMIAKEDFIKEGREYRKVVFEEVVNKDSGYQEFLNDICKKRLEAIPILKERGFTNIKSILGVSENLEEEAVEIAHSNPDKIFEVFSKKYPKGFPKKIQKEDLEKVRYSQNPLLELLNFIWLTRGVSAELTVKSMNDYLRKIPKSKDGEKYRRDYIDKYKLSLTFLLCSIYRRNKQYYSFNTFAFLSSGIVGHFIELCRRSFAAADWGDTDKLLNEGIIAKKFQHQAATDFSNAEKQQIARIETYGGLISKFIENIGNIFRGFHLDFQMRYPETNQFAINVDSIQDEKLQEAMRAAVRWTVIQRKPKMQRSGPSESLQDIYTINRIFCPSFQISYRTRGGKSISLNEISLKKLMLEDKVNLSDYLNVEGTENNEPKNNSYDLFSNL